MTPIRGFLALCLGLSLSFGLSACDPCFGLSTCGGPRIDASGHVLLHLNRRDAPNVAIAFVRTGGVGISPDSQMVVTDAAGRFRLQADAEKEGIVEGRLIFIPAPPNEGMAFTVPDVRIGTVRPRGETRFLGEWGVGPVRVSPQLDHGGELLFRGTGEPVGGATVEFRPTGGVALRAGAISVTTGTDGRFYLRSEALANGEVVGDLVVRSPAPWSAFTVRGLRLRTVVLKGTPIYLGTWGVGGKLHYQGELNWADTYTHAPDIEVEFRRTGGVAVEPDTFVVRTGTDGRFHLRPAVRDTGVVIADLYVRAPRGPFVIPGVRLRVYEGDDPPLIGVWTVERP